MNLTNLILGNQRKELDYSVNYTFSIIISFFTCVFSLSIVFELKESVQPVMFYVLSVFLAAFLIFNEYLKVQELVKFYTPNKQANIFILLITFVLSIGLSVVGIYFWVNSTQQTELASNSRQQVVSDSLSTEQYKAVQDIEARYSLIDNPSYKQEYSALEFQRRQLKHVWKEVDRKPILANIQAIENNIRQISKDLEAKKNQAIKVLQNQYSTKLQTESKKADILTKNTKRNTVITYIMMFLTLLNDFVAIMGARKVAEATGKKEAFLASDMVVKYLDLRKRLKTFLMRKETGDKLYITEISKLNPDLEWNDVSMLFGILDTTKIIEVTEKSKGLFLMDRVQALKAFDQYFTEYFEI